jgi:HPt (histidine-containing phosphotransfer) domain-containing protein
MTKEIDADMLEELRALKTDDDSAFFSKLMKLFLEAVEDGIRGVEEAFRADDPKAARAAAHALKSAAFNVGAKALVTHCQALEDQAATGSLKKAGAAKKELLLRAQLAALEVKGLPELKR